MNNRYLTTPPTTMMPMDVRDVREASPVTIETMSSSWVTEPCGKGGMAVPTGVIAKGLGTSRDANTIGSYLHKEIHSK